MFEERSNFNLKKVSKDLPCFDRIGTPIMINAVFGGLGCENGEVSDSCNLCRRTAKALSNYYSLF